MTFISVSLKVIGQIDETDSESEVGTELCDDDFNGCGCLLI
jgi:hypothetical protein